ncbi:hypothetical protein DPMN_094015 [Dreissena polymorpha]|uniref:Uncharacterized protein n=1 Tax=Dreissena polymorpha TaxID=45954 RepID=A0A9D4R2A2_DREPO|nr:hypothetical protein DPMN_094015 [Dreissena polymorpha]
MNLLTKFHEDRTVYVASREKCPAPWKPFFQANIIIFEIIQDIIETNLLTKFHEDWTINVASRVLTRKMPRPWWPYIIGTNLLTKFHGDRKINVTSRVKIAPPLWWTYIIGINFLTELHEDRTINVASRVKNAPPLGGHVFQANVTIFELIQDIINTNLLTISSRLDNNCDFTIAIYSHIRKNAPPLGSHVFQANVTIF